MTTRRTLLIGAVPLALFGLTCCGLGLPIEVAFVVVTGWGFFAYRVFPQVRIDWGGVVLALVCFTGFVAGLHVFLRWLYAAIPASENVVSTSAGTTPWPLRRTVSISVLVWLLFCAGIGATGVAHQVSWLWNSPEPLVEGGSRLPARRTQSVNNLRQLGLAALGYANASPAGLPPGATFTKYGEALHSWQTLLLPGLDAIDLYQQIDLSVPWNNPRNAPLFKTDFWPLWNPGCHETQDTAGYALSHYSGNVHVIGGDRSLALNEITDGASTTILAGEVAGAFLPWGQPGNWRDPAKGINRSPDGFGGPFPGGANFVLADGSVKFIKNGIDPKVLKALGTPRGGETLPPDY